MSSFSRKYKKYIPAEERKSCLLTALWKTLQKYDESRECKFTSYLYQTCKWELDGWINKDKKRKARNLSLVPQVYGDYTNNLIDEEIEDLLKDLPDNLRKIIVDRYLYGKALGDLAKENNTCYQTLSNKIYKALEIVRNANRNQCYRELHYRVS